MFLSTSASSLKATLVHLLRQTPMSLADLKEATDVSPPTLRRELRLLESGGWVRRVGRTSTGGRPATLYGLSGDTHLIAGIHLELPGVNLALTNLQREIVEFAHLGNEPPLLPDEAVSAISHFIRRAQSNYPGRRLLGAAVATPGYVDPDSGEILSIERTPGWQHFPIKERLEAELELPVLVENDIDCMAVAELGQMNLATVSDAVYVGFSEGVKAAILLDSRLYTGPFGNAGIIGRTLVPDGAGKGRSLEDMASIGQVCAAFDRRAAEMNGDERLQAIAAIRDRRDRFQAILEAAAVEEPLCAALVDEALGTLALAVCNLLYVLQPRLLVVGGALSNLPASLRPGFEQRIRKQLPPLISNHLLVRYARLGDARAAVCGAVDRFLDHYPVEHTIEYV
jgi:glucokinase